MSWIGTLHAFNVLFIAVYGWHPAPAPLATKFSKDVSPDQVPAYPRPTMARPNWYHLNGLWQVDATISDLNNPPFGRTLAQELLVPYPIESPLSGIRNLTEKNYMWQRRLFSAPQDCDVSKERLLLHFEAVDYNATVYLNKQLMGIHAGGYDAFSFDITDNVKDNGHLQNHELLVGVFDPTDQGPQPKGKQSRGAFSNPGGIRYTGTSGIWQTVWLECVPQVYIQDIFNNPDLMRFGGVTVNATVIGFEKGMKIHVDIVVNGTTVGSSEGQADQSLHVALGTAQNTRVWTPDDPFLYNLTISLLSEAGDTVDTVQSYFGLRTVEVALDRHGIPRPMLNGAFLFQVGTLDQGFWPDGCYTAPTDEALAYDLQVHKQLGFNTVRKHVKVEPRRWYYHADRLGLLVWQDMPSGDNNDAAVQNQFQLELQHLVLGRRNHPSIIQWQIFNEGWGQASDDWTKELVDFVQGLDPYRIIDDASGGKCGGCYGNVTDMHHYSPPASPSPDPDKDIAALLGEYGGVLLAVADHQWAPGKCHGYRTVNSTTELTNVYVSYIDTIQQLKVQPGLSASIYTQITDVETECNGVMTYDRITKFDSNRTRTANLALNQ
jgi:hypothetical protein